MHVRHAYIMHLLLALLSGVRTRPVQYHSQVVGLLMSQHQFTAGCTLVTDIGTWSRRFADLIVDPSRDPMVQSLEGRIIENQAAGADKKKKSNDKS